MRSAFQLDLVLIRIIWIIYSIVRIKVLDVLLAYLLFIWIAKIMYLIKRIEILDVPRIEYILTKIVYIL